MRAGRTMTFSNNVRGSSPRVTWDELRYRAHSSDWDTINKLQFSLSLIQTDTSTAYFFDTFLVMPAPLLSALPAGAFATSWFPVQHAVARKARAAGRNTFYYL